MSFELKQKKALPNKTPVINVHVQYGANINVELVNQSLQEAIAFFKFYYPFYKINRLKPMKKFKLNWIGVQKCSQE